MLIIISMKPKQKVSMAIVLAAVLAVYFKCSAVKLAYTTIMGGIVDRLGSVFCQSYVNFFLLCVLAFSV